MTETSVRTFRAILEYEGTRYAGWQRQPRDPSVQQVLEEAIERVTNETTPVAGSGRTDAGVHARGQVASFRGPIKMSPERLHAALNAVLPRDIAVLSVDVVPDDFHARFSAHRKTYRYEILNSRQRRVFDREFMHREPRPLDVEAMREAALRLVGRRDFAAFTCSGGRPGSTVRTLHRLDVLRHGEIVSVEVEGDGFLYKMVRTIVGTLLEVGRRERTPDDVANVLAGRDRRRAGPSAPARGLTLISVAYARSGTISAPTDRDEGESDRSTPWDSPAFGSVSGSTDRGSSGDRPRAGDPSSRLPSSIVGERRVLP